MAVIALLPCFAQTRAGAAKARITPDLKKYAPVFLAGFEHNRVATAIHDELYARCLALAAGEARLVMCGVDSIGLMVDDVEKIRARARKQIGANAEIMVAALHDHHAPDTMGLWGASVTESGINEAYNELVITRTVQAIVEAVRSARPATLKLASAHPPELDSFIFDERPPEVRDAEVIALSAQDSSGKPIGTLVNWANHPQTLGPNNTLVSADYPGYLYTRLEELEGGVAVFINGAVGGMQTPLGAQIPGAQGDSFRKAEIIGRRVAEIASEALKSAAPVRVDRLEYREKSLSIPLANEDLTLARQAGLYKGRRAADTATASHTLVGLIRLADGRKPVLEVACIPGELYPELSVGGVVRYDGADFPDAPIEPPIKGAMKAPFRMLFGLANDEIGYIIPKAEWDFQAPYLGGVSKRWYGEKESVGPEAAREIAGAFQELLRAK